MLELKHDDRRARGLLPLADVLVSELSKRLGDGGRVGDGGHESGRIRRGRRDGREMGGLGQGSGADERGKRRGRVQGQPMGRGRKGVAGPVASCSGRSTRPSALPSVASPLPPLQSTQQSASALPCLSSTSPASYATAPLVLLHRFPRCHTTHPPLAYLTPPIFFLTLPGHRPS